jgi:hypothetical protein
MTNHEKVCVIISLLIIIIVIIVIINKNAQFASEVQGVEAFFAEKTLYMCWKARKY